MALYGARPYWDQRELTELLALEVDGPGRFRSHVCDVDVHGCVYGGQLLGQTVWAAAQGVRGQTPRVLQMSLLQDARLREAIEYSVESLQDTERFSHRHVYGVQGTSLIFSASVAFQQIEVGLDQSFPLDLNMPAPDCLPGMDQWLSGDPQRCRPFQLRVTEHPVLDVRPVPVKNLRRRRSANSDVGYWVRLIEPLPYDPLLHHAALAYLSDCWLAPQRASPLGGANSWQQGAAGKLNHSLWFHSTEINANEWLLFLGDPVRSRTGRDLATTRIYQRSGKLVASMAQEILTTVRS